MYNINLNKSFINFIYSNKNISEKIYPTKNQENISSNNLNYFESINKEIYKKNSSGLRTSKSLPCQKIKYKIQNSDFFFKHNKESFNETTILHKNIIGPILIPENIKRKFIFNKSYDSLDVQSEFFISFLKVVDSLSNDSIQDNYKDSDENKNSIQIEKKIRGKNENNSRCS